MQPDELYRVLEEQYFGDSMHERDEIELLPSLLTGVRTFVDVGASLGQYACFAGRTMKKGRIVCIEADPLRCRRLKELAAEWQRRTGNCYEVIHAAAANRSGRMDFFTTDDCISGGLFQHAVLDKAVANRLTWTKTEIDVVTLDEVFPAGDPDLVKIDVEGAEYRVLEGAAAILARGKCRFLVEVHPWGDEAVHKEPADVFNLFAHHGYDFERTHRHWHFRKSNRPVRRWLKNRAIVYVMRHAWLKNTLKQFILKFGPSSRR